MTKRKPTCYWMSTKTRLAQIILGESWLTEDDLLRRFLHGLFSIVYLAENQDHDVQQLETEGGDDVMLDEALLHPTSDQSHIRRASSLTISFRSTFFKWEHSLRLQPTDTFSHKVLTYIYCTEQCLVSSELKTPHPVSSLHPASVSSPRTKGGGVRTRRPAMGWGSIFWKAPDIGLASYSIIPLRL